MSCLLASSRLSARSLRRGKVDDLIASLRFVLRLNLHNNRHGTIGLNDVQMGAAYAIDI